MYLAFCKGMSPSSISNRLQTFDIGIAWLEVFGEELTDWLSVVNLMPESYIKSKHSSSPTVEERKSKSHDRFGASVENGSRSYDSSPTPAQR